MNNIIKAMPLNFSVEKNLNCLHVRVSHIEETS